MMTWENRRVGRKKQMVDLSSLWQRGADIRYGERSENSFVR
jgi:hypothetical protein